MTLFLSRWRPIVLWVGMYAITFTLFFIETGNFATGLRMGLLSATLKTVWSVIHHKIFHKPLVNAEETVRI